MLFLYDYVGNKKNRNVYIKFALSLAVFFANKRKTEEKKSQKQRLR